MLYSLDGCKTILEEDISITKQLQAPVHSFLPVSKDLHFLCSKDFSFRNNLKDMETANTKRRPNASPVRLSRRRNLL